MQIYNYSKNDYVLNHLKDNGANNQEPLIVNNWLKTT